MTTDLSMLESINSKSEFCTLLNKVKIASGLSLAEIKRAGADVPPSTQSDFLTGKRLPSKRHLALYLKALGKTSDEIQKWEAVRVRLKEQGPPLTSELAQLGDLQSHVDDAVSQLRKIEEQLREQLAEATRRSEQLSRQLDRVRRQAAVSHERADELQRQLDRQSAEYERELQIVNERLAALKRQVKLAERQRERAEAELAEIGTMREELLSTADSFSARLDALARRFENERSRAERVSAENDELRWQLAELRKTIEGGVKYREQPGVPDDRVNADVWVEFPVRAGDLKKIHDLQIECRWFCRSCEMGGDQAALRCPRCDTSTIHHHVRTVKFRIPEGAAYGKRICLRSKGHQDWPDKPPGDIYVDIVKHPSAVQRALRWLGFVT